MVINDLEKSGGGLDAACGVVIGLASPFYQDEGLGVGGDAGLSTSRGERESPVRVPRLTRFQPMTAERRLSKMLVTHS